MQIVKLLKDAKAVHDASNQHGDMHYLVTGAKEVEAAGIPFFRKLGSIRCRTQRVEQQRQENPAQSNASLLHLKSILEKSMEDGNEG